ncbi:HU family DNA-binding protein [Rhodocaloribacter sp.]
MKRKSPMAQISTEQVANALADIVRDGVLGGRAVVVPGLGSFHLEHFPSRLGEDENGRSVVLPPRDTVVFEAEQ